MGGHRRQAPGKASGQIELWDCMEDVAPPRDQLFLVLDQRPEFQRCCKGWRQRGQDILSECWVWQAHQEHGWESGGGLAFLKEAIDGARSVDESLEIEKVGRGGHHLELS